MMKHSLLYTLLFFTCTCFSQEKKVSLLFAGDAMQHQSQLNAAKTAYGYDYSSEYKHVTGQIKQADIAVVNFETTLPGSNYSGYPIFGAPDDFAVALKDAGFNIFLTGNNHILDKGAKALERTITVLDSIKVRHAGVFKDSEKRDLYYPLMIIKNGIRIAMLNYTSHTNGYKVTPPNIVNYIDKAQILKDIDLAKQMKADIIVANMHWGEEYVLKHNKEQQQLADFLIKNGVRLVIGHHPHVVQPIDIQKDSLGIKNVVVYSTGNFVSNMKIVNATGGILVKIDISKNDDNPVKIDSCEYTLVWVYKDMKDKDTPRSYEVIPVAAFENEEGEKKLGKEAHAKMKVFAKNAKNAIEALWEKD